MRFLAKHYRTFLPEQFRLRIWHARNAARFAIRRHFVGLLHDEEEAARKANADFRLSLGLPLAQTHAEGVNLHVDLRDTGVGRPLYIQRSYEPSETAFIRGFLRRGMVFIDVGANIGYYTAIAGQCVGPEGKVIAIEPDPHNFRLLKRTIAGNSLSNVRIENVGLGEKDGTALLSCSTTNFGDHRICSSTNGLAATTKRIRLTTLDKLVERLELENIDLVKMDVQGYEQHVVAGMTKTLAKNTRIRVLTEFWPHGIGCAGGDAEQFFNVFTQAGFLAAVLTEVGPGLPITFETALRLLPKFDPLYPDRAYINVLFYRP